MTKTKNQITNLYDAFGDGSNGLILDWGLSLYIEFKDRKILFDGGSSVSILKKNAEVLGVDFSELDYVILSHDHSDHSAGIDTVLDVNPTVKIFLPNDYNIGGQSEVDDHKRRSRYHRGQLHYCDHGFKIEEGIYMIATTSELVGNFYRYPPHDKEPRLDGLPEISILLVDEENEKRTLFVGCSHSEVEKIAVKASEFSKGESVDFLVGGFHLLPYELPQIQTVVKTLQEKAGVNQVAPAHCTGEKAKGVLKERFGDEFFNLGVGSRLEF